MLRQSRQPWKPSPLSRTLSMIAILCGGVFAAGLRGAQSETPNDDAAQSEPAEEDISSRTRRHWQQHAAEKQAAIALHGTWAVVHRSSNGVIRPIAPGDYYYWIFDAATKRVSMKSKLDGNKHPRTADGELPPKTRFSINPTTNSIVSKIAGRTVPKPNRR